MSKKYKVNDIIIRNDIEGYSLVTKVTKYDVYYKSISRPEWSGQFRKRTNYSKDFRVLNKKEADWIKLLYV